MFWDGQAKDENSDTAAQSAGPVTLAANVQKVELEKARHAGVGEGRLIRRASTPAADRRSSNIGTESFTGTSDGILKYCKLAASPELVNLCYCYFVKKRKASVLSRPYQ